MIPKARLACGRRTKSVLKTVGLGLVVVAGAAALLGYRQHAANQRQARDVRDALEAAADPSPPLYDPAMVADLPEVARRYFARASPARRSTASCAWRWRAPSC